MKIDMMKQYRTRDGREAKVFMVDGGSKFPVIAAYKDKDGRWWAQHYMQDGRIHEAYEDHRDLIEIRPRIKQTVWLNLYKHNSVDVQAYHNKNFADRCAADDRIACVKVEIDCEEGEGL